MQSSYVSLTDYPLLIYTALENRISAAISLLSFGIYQFKKTVHFTEKNKLLADLERARDHGAFGEHISKLAEDSLIEYTRIIVCFQNYMFAKLLYDGYLVHKINRNEFKDMSNNQKLKPIKIHDFTKVSSCQTNNLGCEIWQGLENETINFSTLLKSGYQQAIQPPEIIHAVLKEYNKLRNQQHFHIMETTQKISIKVQANGSNECVTIDQIEALYNFVEIEMTQLLEAIEASR